ncbi:MAG: HEAT repeat domain-containing protein [Candidatus Thorarchaeota archaeon]
MMWHDGIDTSSVKWLKGEEREKAIEMLVQSMKEGSYWAPMGLRELKAISSIPDLKQELQNAGPRALIEIAHALNTIEETSEYMKYILLVLKKGSHWTFRMYAAILLREYNAPEVIEALYDSMLDPDYLVRNHASESLLSIHGLQPSISSHKEIFKEIIVEFDPKDSASFESAKQHYRNAANLLRDTIAQEKR